MCLEVKMIKKRLKKELTEFETKELEIEIEEGTKYQKKLKEWQGLG